MLEEARKYLLAVGVFGWEDFDKKPAPFFDERCLEKHVAAIILAAYYLQPKERILILIRKTDNLFPGRLNGSVDDGADLEALFDKFADYVRLVTSSNFLDKEENFAFLVDNVVSNYFNPPQ
jgi:hypothetical protein